jgi:hypothetical protein
MTQDLRRYTLAMLATFAGTAWLLTLTMRDAGANTAIFASAIVAAVVQVGAFALTRRLISSNMTAALGAGALLRFVVLVAYALIAVKGSGLPAFPALVSLFVFFFLAMLLEPVFLRR